MMPLTFGTEDAPGIRFTQANYGQRGTANKSWQCEASTNNDSISLSLWSSRYYLHVHGRQISTCWRARWRRWRRLPRGPDCCEDKPMPRSSQELKSNKEDTCRTFCQTKFPNSNIYSLVQLRETLSSPPRRKEHCPLSGWEDFLC